MIIESKFTQNGRVDPTWKFPGFPVGQSTTDLGYKVHNSLWAYLYGFSRRYPEGIHRTQPNLTGE